MPEIGDSYNGNDPYEHQPSYIFTPSPAAAQSSDHRPAKRRKVAKQKVLDVALPEDLPLRFPTLLGGAESQECVQLRQQLYLDSWASTEHEILKITQSANKVTLDQVAEFVKHSAHSSFEDQIPAGLIVTGPNIASQELLFSQVTKRLKADETGAVVTLRSADAPNLKAALKRLIRDATNQRTDENDEDFMPQKDGRKLLNYDLEILRCYFHGQVTSRVVVAFQDTEAFDSGLLAEMLHLFSSWLDRIKFVVLFGIATSVELFHERLPRTVVRLLHGTQFDVEQTEKTVAKIFKAVVANDKAILKLGPSFITALLDRQQEHVQSLQSFVMSLKYAYMTHFYANPLSILLARPKHIRDVTRLLQPEHFEAIRTLPSFRLHVEALVENGDHEPARLMLESDDVLVALIKEDTVWSKKDERNLESADICPKLHSQFIRLLHRLDVITFVGHFAKGRPLDYTELYISAIDGTLEKSDVIEDLLDSFKYHNGDELTQAVNFISATMEAWIAEDDRKGTLHKVPEDEYEKFLELRRQLSGAWSDTDVSTYALRKQQTRTLRTTVVAQRIHLNEQQTPASVEDIEMAEAYTKIVREVIATLQSYLQLPNFRTRLFNEICFYNSRSPGRQVFGPRPRYSTEAALLEPHAYLDCDCCNTSEEGLSSTNPPTAILYQLYLETGGLINIFDLWSAFNAIVGGERGEDCDERIALALFYRALSELKMMGMVKSSRKKIDHLAKTAWMGL